MVTASGCRAERDVQRMRVIVTLDVADMRDDFRDGPRRDETRELRDRLLDRLDSGDVVLLDTLELTGQVVLEIDAHTLAAVENAPEVRAVAKDRLLSPFAGKRQ
jgi:hypothetical protein